MNEINIIILLFRLIFFRSFYIIIFKILKVQIFLDANEKKIDFKFHVITNDE